MRYQGLKDVGIGVVAAVSLVMSGIARAALGVVVGFGAIYVLQLLIPEDWAIGLGLLAALVSTGAGVRYAVNHCKGIWRTGLISWFRQGGYGCFLVFILTLGVRAVSLPDLFVPWVRSAIGGIVSDDLIDLTVSVSLVIAASLILERILKGAARAGAR